MVDVADWLLIELNRLREDVEAEASVELLPQQGEQFVFFKLDQLAAVGLLRFLRFGVLRA